MTKAVISGDREPCTGFSIFIFFYVCDSSTHFFRTNIKGSPLKGWVVF